MPSTERGFLIGSVIGPIAGLMAVVMNFVPGLLIDLLTLSLDASDISYCESTFLTIELAFWSLIAIPAATMLAWFVAKQRNANREADEQASTRAAAAGGFLGATLVLLLLTAGAGAVVCTDPLAV